MLSLVTVALVAIALLLTAPLASLASARVEARAGDVVAIAGDEDCDVETNDTDEGDILGAEDEDGGTQTQDENNGDQTQNDGLTQDGDQVQVDDNGDNRSEQVQDGDDDGDRVVARAGDTVAVAAEDCDVETSVETEDIEDDNSDDIAIEDDEEIEDSTSQTDGETLDTSDLSMLPPELRGISDELSTGEDTTQENTAQENQPGLGLQLEANEPAGQILREDPGLGREQLKSLLLSDGDFSLPKKRELDRIGKPRRFDRKPGAAMSLSIRGLRLYDVPVTNSNTRKAFDQGIIHVPDTAFPWDQENEKNVFLAGHRLGDPGEADSRLVFYHLDELKPKDEIVLKDRRGRSYKYRVKELFKVEPDDAWVADTLVGRDLLTLMTYTLPNLEDRIVVRADRVQEDPGQDPDRIQQGSSRRSDPDRQPNPVVQQDSKGQQDSVRRQDSTRKQDSTRQPNSGPKKKKRK